MKLYLSSYRVPVLDEFVKLIGKPFADVRLALIPNAKDYYAERAWKFKVNSYGAYFSGLGARVDVVDLRSLSGVEVVKEKLSAYDVVWAAGGNTFCLRYAMRSSGFELALPELLQAGVVYGGDSAGALVAGRQIGGIGIEQADTPEFAEEVITEGLNLIPEIILPHADDPEFMSVTKVVRERFKDVIELTNAQALIVDGTEQQILTSSDQN